MVVQINFKALRKTRTQVMDALKRENIGSQLHYIPLYRHPCYRDKIGDIEDYFPEMEAYYASALSLPLYYDLNETDVDRICRLLSTICQA
jgi:dTDP-4-amino-4,6-dideoxygalactose transaminase